MDYRDSHLNRGDSYDSYLASAPFDAYLSAWEARHIRTILTEYFPHGIPRYLDFACGTARITGVIAPHAKHAFGVDVAESMLKQARDKISNVTFYCRDLTQSNLEPELGRFDLISAFRFFGNAEQSLRLAVLAALNRHLLPGGYLLINNHRNPNSLVSRLYRATGTPNDMDLSHGKLYAALHAQGFKLVARQPIGAWVWRARAMSKANPDGRTEWLLEKIFSGSAWSRIAPDCILVAQKFRETRI